MFGIFSGWDKGFVSLRGIVRNDTLRPLLSIFLTTSDGYVNDKSEWTLCDSYKSRHICYRVQSWIYLIICSLEIQHVTNT